MLSFIYNHKFIIEQIFNDLIIEILSFKKIRNKTKLIIDMIALFK